jgi:RNA polymerase sigma-70 factor (ECF subfamily)
MGLTKPVTTHPATSPSPAGRRRPVSVDAVALLRVAQAGDRDAFGQLYAGYAQAVRRYVAARMRHTDRDAVPDLVQDTFAAALEELDRAYEDVEGWLIGLAAKMCTRHSWAQRRYLRAALSTGEQQRSQASSEPVQAPSPAARALIAQALAALDPGERRTLQLRFLDGQHRMTTARIMGCSLWTVRQRQRRGLTQLGTWLRAEVDAPAQVTR